MGPSLVPGHELDAAQLGGHLVHIPAQEGGEVGVHHGGVAPA